MELHHESSRAQALRKGIRDAVLGAFSSAFNNYLDLGAGVLILWYGGSIAMKGDGAITVGSLIKYQLYWNMINNAWQVRASISRVQQLMIDSIPRFVSAIARRDRIPHFVRAIAHD